MERSVMATFVCAGFNASAAVFCGFFDKSNVAAFFALANAFMSGALIMNAICTINSR